MRNKVILVASIAIFIVVLVVVSLIVKEKSNIAPLKDKVQESNKEEKRMKITKENFEEEVLKSEKVVLIDFYAKWCGPCSLLSPIVEEIAEENEDIKVVKIDVDEEVELASEFGIISIPTLIVIKEGKEVDRVVGLVEKEQILEMVK